MKQIKNWILIGGGGVLLWILSLTEYHQQGPEGVIWPANHENYCHNIWDWQTALVQALIVSAATLAFYFAFKDEK